MNGSSLVRVYMATIVLAAGALLWSASPAYADPADDLIKELMCPAPVISQPLATSDTPEAIWMRDFVRRKMAEGWSKQRIIDTLVRQYGECILATPPKQGFSLAAWITPFITIFGSAAIVAYLMTGWLREKRWHDAYLDAEMASTLDDEELEKYEAQLYKELAKFE